MTACPHAVPIRAGLAGDRRAAAFALLGVMAGQSGGCGIRTHEETHAS